MCSSQKVATLHLGMVKDCCLALQAHGTSCGRTSARPPGTLAKMRWGTATAALAASFAACPAAGSPVEWPCCSPSSLVSQARQPSHLAGSLRTWAAPLPQRSSAWHPLPLLATSASAQSTSAPCEAVTSDMMTFASLEQAAASVCKRMIVLTHQARHGDVSADLECSDRS
jgi:hypothetical protein